MGLRFWRRVAAPEQVVKSDAERVEILRRLNNAVAEFYFGSRECIAGPRRRVRLIDRPRSFEIDGTQASRVGENQICRFAITPDPSGSMYAIEYFADLASIMHYPRYRQPPFHAGQ